MEHEQLALLKAHPSPWALDPHTREIGRRGLQMARQALLRAKGTTERSEGQGPSEQAA